MCADREVYGRHIDSLNRMTDKDIGAARPEPLPIVSVPTPAENERERGEPVAWHILNEERQVICWHQHKASAEKDVATYYAHRKVTVEPLYAHPDPAVERLQRELEEAQAKSSEWETLANNLQNDVERLESELDAAQFAHRSGKSLAEDSIYAIRELLNAQGVPPAAFIDDHVGNAIAQRNQAEARALAAEASIAKAREAHDLLRRAGMSLSNITYNLAQNNRFTADERASFDTARRVWDQACDAARSILGDQPT